MSVDADLRPSFLAGSDEAARCVREGELRLSKYAFGPARSPSAGAIEEAVIEQIDRIEKYLVDYRFKIKRRDEGL